MGCFSNQVDIDESYGTRAMWDMICLSPVFLLQGHNADNINLFWFHSGSHNKEKTCSLFNDDLFLELDFFTLSGHLFLLLFTHCQI